MDSIFVNALVFYVVLLISLVCHEASHAWVAYLGGDKTAYLGGQVTLNPLPHIRREPFGTVFLPIGMLLMSKGTMCMGFAHAPFDPIWAYRHPKRAALMSAAGPIANLLLATLAMLVLKVLISMDHAETWYQVNFFELVRQIDGGDGTRAVIRIASIFAVLNVLLAVLNLFPFPPFDGAGIIEGLFPKTRGLYQMVRDNQLVQLVLVIVPMLLLFNYPEKTWVPVLNAFYGILKL